MNDKNNDEDKRISLLEYRLDRIEEDRKSEKSDRALTNRGVVLAIIAAAINIAFQWFGGGNNGQ
jgi:hypothetical protein